MEALTIYETLQLVAICGITTLIISFGILITLILKLIEETKGNK